MKELFVPDHSNIEDAMSRVTDLCIAAHQDDVEIMAYGPTEQCYGQKDRCFGAVVVADGAGSPRSGIYADYTDEEMKAVRITEQKNAATIGRYGVLALLGYPSATIKDGHSTAVRDDIYDMLFCCAPKTVYTHNLADKHDTHVAVALRTIAALRALPVDKRPEKVYSLEVWRGLDWLCDEDKACFDTSGRPHLAAALLGVYDSQIAGGKRYDSAAMGRRLANATFFASHATDQSDSLSYGLDITELVYSDIAPDEFIARYIERFRTEVENRITALL